ncbi:MAG: hypothetical protein WC909_03240, partial [Candidatus Paceibacterota bacterium]
SNPVATNLYCLKTEITNVLVVWMFFNGSLSHSLFLCRTCRFSFLKVLILPSFLRFVIDMFPYNTILFQDFA